MVWLKAICVAIGIAAGILFATATRPPVLKSEFTCSPNQYERGECAPMTVPAIILRNDPGGNVDDHLKWYRRLARSHIPVRIVGECNSACTFVLKLPPAQVCMTRGSTLGFHLASTNGKVDRKVTRQIVHDIYPKPVRDWIRANGPLHEWVKPMSAKTAVALGIVRAC